ncbi:hypothetical protein BLOT_013323 [Blomia tropicalis]|nr:hypothetical protein BLOT_013323 [Blomia tropicalis]
MFIAVFMYSGYYIYLMYFCDYTELNHILFQIMVLQSTDKIFRLPKINRKHLIWHQVKRFTTFLTTFFQMFVVASGMKYNLDNNDCNKWFFYMLIVIDSFTLIYTLYGWIKLLIVELNIIMFAIVLHIFSFSNILVATHLITFFFAWNNASIFKFKYNDVWQCTKNKYGLTYYKIAIISMSSFVKYLILYTELLMMMVKFISKGKMLS